jgi:uncharacterized protein (DUF433 family)
MTATLPPRAPIERTEHPHVVKSADTLGGEPRVEEGRISVLQIFTMAEHGMTAEEIVADFPDLTLAQVHDALSYAHDHPDEMEYHRERHKLRNILKAYDMVFYDHQLLTREQLAELGPLPPGAEVYTWETLPPDLDE